MSIIFRCGIKSCPHFAAPCEFREWDCKCPIGEIDAMGFEEIYEPENEFFCLVIGSRSFTDYKLLAEKMDKMLQNMQGKRIIIVSGGADGTDTLAKRYAEEREYKLYVINADWSQGNKAGFVRNEEMHRFIASHENRGCIAFWDGENKETQHSFTLSKKYNNQLRVIRIN